MAKRKEILPEYTGDITLNMAATCIHAGNPDNYEARIMLATIMFYHKPKMGDGLLVRGTKSLIVTEEIADEYIRSLFGSEK